MENSLVSAPYEHDYGVCNRFKEYEVEVVAPVEIATPNGGGNRWFWHADAKKGTAIDEEARPSHIFVDEAGKKLHIDSHWTQDDYPDTIAYPFDYVFNMQVWSSNLADSKVLLGKVLEKLTQLDSGAWQVVYHNQTLPTQPAAIIQKVNYQADAIQIDFKKSVCRWPTSAALWFVAQSSGSKYADSF